MFKEKDFTLKVDVLIFKQQVNRILKIHDVNSYKCISMPMGFSSEDTIKTIEYLFLFSRIFFSFVMEIK